MSTIILVHGGWCGSWSWKYNVEAIEKAGHKVIAVDLPGHGANHPENLPNVHLKDYVDCIKEVIDGIDGKVVLAAHSMTGMVVAQLAEDLGEKIEKLIFIAAFMPDTKAKNMIGYMESDPWSCVNESTLVPIENGLLVFNPLYARNLGFGCCSDEIFGFALKNAQPETPNMWSDEVHLGENYLRVPKYYVHTLKDNCLSYYMQRTMVKQTPVVKQYYLDADHCCMLSTSDGLNECIIDALANVPMQI